MFRNVPCSWFYRRPPSNCLPGIANLVPRALFPGPPPKPGKSALGTRLRDCLQIVWLWPPWILVTSFPNRRLVSTPFLPEHGAHEWVCFHSFLCSHCILWPCVVVKTLLISTMISPSALNMFSPSSASSEDIGSSSLFPSLDTGGLSTSGITSEEVEEQPEDDESE